jgi:hypothetical protein
LVAVVGKRVALDKLIKLGSFNNLRTSADLPLRTSKAQKLAKKIGNLRIANQE